jgi:hypothetical protein
MKLVSVTGNLHGGLGEELDRRNPISIRFDFDNGAAIRIRGASDGENILLDDLPLPDPVDMEEWGRTERRNLSGSLPLSFLERDIARLNGVCCESATIGLLITLHDGSTFGVWNYGDELYYGSFDELISYDWGPERPAIGNAISLR